MRNSILKRSLSWLMVLAMLLTMLPSGVIAVDSADVTDGDVIVVEAAEPAEEESIPAAAEPAAVPTAEEPAPEEPADEPAAEEPADEPAAEDTPEAEEPTEDPAAEDPADELPAPELPDEDAPDVKEAPEGDLEPEEATDALGRLPIHYFLASPGNIVNPEGSYINYGTISNNRWPESYTINNIQSVPAWDQIKTTNGIRNVSDEDVITQYIGTWPGGDRAAFEDFGSVTIDGVRYSDTEYEIKWVSIMCRDNNDAGYGLYCNQYSSARYEHIHVDGLLVKKVQPGTMEVYKTIPAAQSTAATFQFTLQKMNQPSLTTPPTSANDIDTSFPAMTLTAYIPAGETQAHITGGSDITFGYYKLTEIGASGWETAGIALTDSSGRTTVVDADSLYICIAPNGSVLYSTNPSGTYSTMSKVAIQNERASVSVDYEWRVMAADGTYGELPAGAPGEPATVTGLTVGTSFNYDKEYAEGTSFIDYEAGLMYTFHGWDVYSLNSNFSVDPTQTGYTAITGNTVPVNGDTYLYGYWTVSELAPDDAHIAIEKIFRIDLNGDGDFNDAGENVMADAEDCWWRIDPGIDRNGDGVSQIDVDYSMIAAGGGEYKIPVYQYDTPFIFTEHNADVDGYTRTTTITVSGDNASLVSVGGDTVTVALEENYSESTDSFHLGTVTYTNTYTKNTGDAVGEYPTLTIAKRDVNTLGELNGVEFVLSANADMSGELHNVKTVNGLAVIDFEGMTAGTYYLQETKAAEGYVLDSTVYPVTLTAGQPVEELRVNPHTGDFEYVLVTYYSVSVEIPEGSTSTFFDTTDRLNVYNEPILGGVRVSKDINGVAEDDLDSVSATVVIHGPITRSGDTVTDEGATYTLTLDSENAWIDAIGNLPLGEYLIHESFASVHGYTWTGVTYSGLQTVSHDGDVAGVFAITADDAEIELNLVNDYEVWTSADFYVRKQDASGNRLSGAAFQLFYDANCTQPVPNGREFTNYAVTNDRGNAYFSGFTVPEDDTDGIMTYYLKEVEAPAGYYLDTTVYKVEIKAVTNDGVTTYEPRISVADNGAWPAAEGFDNVNDLLTVINEPVLGALIVTKEIVVDNFPEALPQGLESVEVHVSGPNGYSNVLTLSEENNWFAAIENLPLGEYTVHEHDANVPGYTLNGVTYTVDGADSANEAVVTLAEFSPGQHLPGAEIQGEVNITNTYSRNETLVEDPASLRVMKVGEDGTTPLPGAVFKLTRNYDGMSVTAATNASGYVEFYFMQGILENGEMISDSGKYTLEEVTPPTGYAAADTTWTVTVAENDGKLEIRLNEAQNVFESIWDWIISGVTGKEGTYTFDPANGLTPATLTVKNYELADLTITKSFEDSEGNAITPPDGAIIELALTDSEGKLVQQIELSAEDNWTVTVDNLPAGEYTLREVVAALHGYAWNGMIEATVNGEVYQGNEGAKVTFDVENSAEVAVSITNGYTEWESADFYVFKAMADGVSPLAGATFTLYDADMKDVTTQYLHDDDYYHTSDGNTTGSGGVLHFQGFTAPDGGTATFYLKETGAPEGYYAVDTTYTVTVTDAGDSYDIEVAGGRYNPGNNVLTVVNTPILGNLTITKEFGADNDLVPAYAAVRITGPNDYDRTVYLSGNNNWTVELKDLALGLYTVTELDARQTGYDLDVAYEIDGMQVLPENNAIKVSVTAENDNDAKVVTVINTYDQKINDVINPAAFTVLKVDENGDPLEGAQFTLYDATAHQVEVAVTGEDGKVTFGGFDEAAEYTLVETMAPEYFVRHETNWEITVSLEDGDPTLELNESKNWFDRIYDWIVGIDDADDAVWDGETLTLTVPNVRTTSDLLITKTVEYWEGDKLLAGSRETGLEGETYTFELTIWDGNDEIWMEETMELADGETWLVDDVPNGYTYYVEEVVPEGAAFEAFVSADGGTVEAGKAEVVDVDGTQMTVIPIELINRYHYEGDPAVLEFYKMDSATGAMLDGALFTVTYDEAGEEIFGTFETDEEGKVSITLPAKDATYYLQETQAPEDYQLNETVFTVETAVSYSLDLSGTYPVIVAETDVTTDLEEYGEILIVRNERMVTNLLVSKTVEYWKDGTQLTEAPDTGLEEETYTFHVAVWLDTDGDFEIDETEDVYMDDETEMVDGATWWISDVPQGYSYIVEEIVPEGAPYTSSGAVQGMIDLDKAQYVEEEDIYAMTAQIVNRYDYADKPETLEFYKVDADTGATISGAVFTLSADKAGSEVLGNYESDSQGKVTVTLPVEEGTYYLRETQAPDGYHLNDTVYTVSTNLSYDVEVVDGAPVITTFVGVEADMDVMEDHYVVENTAIKVFDISVNKVWYGDDAATRPTSVQATLYRDGKAYDTVTLNAGNKWSHTWNDLTDEYTWSVGETEVPEGYTARVTVDGYDFTITNYAKHIPLTGDMAMPLLWVALVLAAVAVIVLAARKLRKGEK